MGDIFDYLEWRGDIAFTGHGICDADFGVFGCLSYIPFDDIVSDSFKENRVLKTALEKVLALEGENADGRTFQMKEDRSFLEKLRDCPRYTDIRLTGYVNIRDTKKQEQFAAMTLLLPEGSILILFRGTDRTLVGWREDFNMSFAETLPSQRDAVKYIEKAASKLKGNIIVCGHSKGGNLAMYSAAHCNGRIRDRIGKIVNLDGPGFFKENVDTAGLMSISDRIVSFIPQASIVGMLLEHEEKSVLVHSTAPLFSQHHIYTWGFRRGGFEEEKELKAGSVVLDMALKQWVEEFTVHEREKLVEGLFDIVAESDAATLDELVKGRNVMALLKGFSHMDEETKAVLDRAYSIFKDAIKKSIPLAKKEEQPQQ